jgi:hypothetical protein
MLSTPELPNLAGVITLSDVKQKGSGSYAADYVPWAKVMQLLNEKANGWLPELIKDANGELVHKAPNGTGYLCIQFVNGNYGTPVWTYAVMDNRNQAIAYEKISARDLADSHRRGICSAAAAFFSLGYELWAREEVAAASEKVETQPEIQLQQDAPKPADKKKGRPAPPKESSASKTVDLDGQIAKCMELIQQRLDRTQQVAWIADKATKWNLDGDGSKLKQMTFDQLQACIDELSAKPALKQ